MREDFDAVWNQLAHEVMSGMKEWRLQHPKATLREIEAALDERLGKMRARMLEDGSTAPHVCGTGQRCGGCESAAGDRAAPVSELWDGVNGTGSTDAGSDDAF